MRATKTSGPGSPFGVAAILPARVSHLEKLACFSLAYFQRARSCRAEGVPVLFRGVGASMLRAFPMHGLVFVGYETTIGLMAAR